MDWTTLKLRLPTETLICLNIIGWVGGSLLRCNYDDQYLACEQEDFCERYIKACFCYFHQIFIFSPNDSPSATEKCFLFHLKRSFRSRDIQIFVFLSFPLFRRVGHCFRGWSKIINLKIHDVINCLNKNSLTHFVSYLKKKKRYAIEILFIDRALDKKHLHRKIMQKICNKS